MNLFWIYFDFKNKNIKFYCVDMAANVAMEGRVATWQRACMPCGKSVRTLTRRDREVVDFTWSRVKNNTELTNLGN